MSVERQPVKLSGKKEGRGNEAYFLVEDGKTRMDDSKIKLDEGLAVRRDDGFDGIQNLDISSVVGRLDVRELLEIDVGGDLAERATLGRVLSSRLVVGAKRQYFGVVLS